MENKILTKRQLLILKKISEDEFINKNFYLTGGTALAGVYLQHRISEDLDFFSEKEFDVSLISVFLQKNKKEIGFDKIDFQQSYNRNIFFLHFPNEILKVEFTYFPFVRIDETAKEFGVSVDSKIDIATNKLFTIYQRTAARDYIDLYCMVKEYGWEIEDLIKKAKVKFDWHIDPLQLGAQFIKAETVSDLPRMIEHFDKLKWREFFIEEAKKLKDNVLK